MITAGCSFMRCAVSWANTGVATIRVRKAAVPRIVFIVSLLLQVPVQDASATERTVRSRNDVVCAVWHAPLHLLSHPHRRACTERRARLEPVARKRARAGKKIRIAVDDVVAPDPIGPS